MLGLLNSRRSWPILVAHPSSHKLCLLSRCKGISRIMAHQSADALRNDFIKLARQSMRDLIRVFPTPITSKVTIQGGVPYESYDARARVFPWSLMRAIECSHTCTTWDIAETDNPQSMMEFHKLNNIFFMAAFTMELEPEFYNPKVEKKPLIVENEIKNIGTKSFMSASLVRFGETPVALCKDQNIFVDPEKRRAVSPPDWWREKYVPLVSNEEPPIKLPRLVPPQGGSTEVYEASREVTASELDPNGHLNWSSYVKYSYEIYVAWHVKTHGWTGNGDPYRKLKSATSSHLGESNLLDVLAIKFWVDSSATEKYNFLFINREVPVADVTLEFYSASVSGSKI